MLKLFKANYKAPNGLEFTFITECYDDLFLAANDLREVAAATFGLHVGQLSKREAVRTSRKILRNPNCQKLKFFRGAWII